MHFLTARFPGFLAYGWGQNQRRASHSVVAILARFFAFAAELVFARTLAIQSAFRFAGGLATRRIFSALRGGSPRPCHSYTVVLHCIHVGAVRGGSAHTVTRSAHIRKYKIRALLYSLRGHGLLSNSPKLARKMPIV